MAHAALFSSPLSTLRAQPQAEASVLNPTTPWLAVDLHAHSHYADAVAKSMTLENISPWAQRKGIDVLGTGDCLQPNWLAEIRIKMFETGTGLLMLRPDVEKDCVASLPRHLRRPLRFLLSTEVCCAPGGPRSRGRHHHLIFFPSIESVLRFRSRIQRYGDLAKGRPTLSLSSREVLDFVVEQGDGTALAPAHVLNPWHSALGSMDGGQTLTDVFGDATDRILAIEMGLTATPEMCRQISALDAHALFCSSDAHSLENIGREYTLLNVELSYLAIMKAIRAPAEKLLRRYIKFPSERAGYYFNYCRPCHRSYHESICPTCGQRLPAGTHDRVARIADRPASVKALEKSQCQTLYPLAFVIGDFIDADAKSKRVQNIQTKLVDAMGSERYVLTEATESEIAGVTISDLARAIVQQRIARWTPTARRGQLSFDL
jgi:PHP family Zn ribbon phosphoesterase